MNGSIYKNKRNVLREAPQGTISAEKKKHQQKFHWAVVSEQFYSDVHSAITIQYPFPFSPFLQGLTIGKISSASSSNLRKSSCFISYSNHNVIHRQEQTLSATISIILDCCITTNLQNKFITMWDNLLSAFHSSPNSILHPQWINLITAHTEGYLYIPTHARFNYATLC